MSNNLGSFAEAKNPITVQLTSQSGILQSARLSDFDNAFLGFWTSAEANHSISGPINQFYANL